jgi:hemoglobin
MTIEPRDAPEYSPLYERLGGWGCIAIVAELWCDRVLADPKLAHYFAGADPTTLRREQTDFLIHAVGGPVKVPAETTPSLYRPLPHTNWHAERVIGHLIAALVWANVPRRVIEETIDAVESFLPSEEASKSDNG